MTAQGWIRVRIARRWSVATDVDAFELVADGGATLPPFEAGAHIDVEVEPGLIRQYSLCNNPAERQRYVIAVLRASDSRGGSAGVHERLRESAVVRIGMPRNLFPLVTGARHHLLLAGGIGVTPLLAMARKLSAEGESFRLHYFARSKARAAFLSVIQAQPLAPCAQLHLDDQTPIDTFDLRRCLAEQPIDTHLYVCGPSGFMQSVSDAAESVGWPATHLHRESFAANPAAAEGSDRPFELELARSGRVVPVPCDMTALTALRAAGIDVDSSCEAGICGTCLTGVLKGTPDHRDAYLTEEERAQGTSFLPCCSRAVGARLTIDL